LVAHIRPQLANVGTMRRGRVAGGLELKPRRAGGPF